MVIRGHIEVATHEVVQGWIYDSDGRTRNKVVLAFSGADCVGSGKVDIYRPDLRDAGLGDGYLGFSFGVTLDPAAVGSMVVRFDGSDAVLLQAGAVVSAAGTPPPAGTRPPADARVAAETSDAALLPAQSGAQPAAEAHAPGAATMPRVLDRATQERQIDRLRWQLKRARLSQAEFDYLRILWSVGVYERTLLKRPDVGKTAVADAVMGVAAELLEAYLGAEADLTVIKSVTAATFKSELAKVKEDARIAPVFALCSNDRVAVRAAEGSHVLADPDEPPRRPHYVDHKLGPDSLLIMDARLSAELYSPVGLTVSLVTAAVATATA